MPHVAFFLLVLAPVVLLLGLLALALIRRRTISSQKREILAYTTGGAEGRSSSLFAPSPEDNPLSIVWQNETPAAPLRVFLLGDSNTGKTTFRRALINPETIPKNPHKTIGVAYDALTSGDKKYQVWDVAGDHKPLAQFFDKTSHVLLFVDLSTPLKETALQTLIERCQSVFQVAPNCKVFLIANKCDLDPQITDEALTNLFLELKKAFPSHHFYDHPLKCSAKEQINVQAIKDLIFPSTAQENDNRKRAGSIPMVFG